MEYKDYYKILGVDKTASAEEIKKKYRKMARTFHPDVNPHKPDAEAKFKEISEAYEVLSNPENRKKYDTMGADWKRYEQAGQQPGRQYRNQNASQGQYYSNFGEGGEDFSDFFSSFFGGHGGNTGFRQQNLDLQATLTLSLEDAYNGGPTTIQVNGHALRINLKPGLQDEQTIRLKGKGNINSKTGAQGDLLITFQILPHALFNRRGHDLYLEVKVPFYTLVLGGEAEIPTLTSNTIKAKLAPYTPNNHTIRLKGKGMPVYGKTDEFGNLYVKLIAEMPANLSERERELMQELASLQKQKNGRK